MTTLIETHGQRFALEKYRYPADVDMVRSQALQMADAAFDRYDNPFEAKLTLRDKHQKYSALDSVFQELESNEWVEYVSELFGVPLVADRWRHYAGLFRYLPDDHLGVHVDAAIHPISGLRKHVTLVLYFGEGAGDLELWSGTSCVSHMEGVTGVDGSLNFKGGVRVEPEIHEVIASIPPDTGTMVMFECNDFAWHGTRQNTSDEDRLVLTVSYLSAAIAPAGNMMNQRQRAFFVPRPTEEWGPETYALRDRRADPERYAEAYRGG